MKLGNCRKNEQKEEASLTTNLCDNPTSLSFESHAATVSGKRECGQTFTECQVVLL